MEIESLKTRVQIAEATAAAAQDSATRAMGNSGYYTSRKAPPLGILNSQTPLEDQLSGAFGSGFSSAFRSEIAPDDSILNSIIDPPKSPEVIQVIRWLLALKIATQADGYTQNRSPSPSTHSQGFTAFRRRTRHIQRTVNLKPAPDSAYYVEINLSDAGKRRMSDSDQPPRWSRNWWLRYLSIVFLGQFKIPGWLGFAFAVFWGVPGWQSKFDYWLRMAKSSSDWAAPAADSLLSPYFSPTLALVQPSLCCRS